MRDTYQPPRRFPRATVVAIAAVVVIAAGALVAISVGIIGGGDGAASSTSTPTTPVSTASATMGPSASQGASALPSPSADGTASELEVDALARTTVNGLNVRRTPTTSGERLGSLVAGETGLILDGPVGADGTEWVLLGALGLPPNSGCVAPYTTDPFNCPIWVGWVAIRSPSDGTAWLEPVAWDCPDPVDYAQFAALTSVLQLSCTGERSVTLTAWWAGADPQAGCFDAPPGVDWLFCPWAFGGRLGETGEASDLNAMPLTVDPGSGVALLPPGRMVTVTGHYDDPAAADCAVVPGGSPGDAIAAAAQVLQCRATLVVDAMVEAP